MSRRKKETALKFCIVCEKEIELTRSHWATHCKSCVEVKAKERSKEYSKKHYQPKKAVEEKG